MFLHGSLFFCAKTIAFPVKKRYHGCRRKQKELRPCGRRPATTPERKGASFYEKLEEITGLPAGRLDGTDRVHRLRCQRGQTDGSPKRSDAESAKALCESFKGVTYDEELSEKAYYIAYWVAGTSVSCSTNANKTELYRVGSANDSAKINLLQHNYATAFDSMGIGKGIGGGMGADDFIPGFYIDTDLDSRKDYISFTLPNDGRVTDTMTKAAEGKTKLGVAYVVKDGVSYAVVLFG